jgi:hypothetical protein
VLFAFAYLLLRRVLQLVAGSSTDLSKDVELVVLRHQLKVLKRRVDTPRLRRRDRLFMAAMSRNLPRFRWSSLSALRRSFAGTGSWCEGNGPTHGAPSVADRG